MEPGSRPEEEAVEQREVDDLSLRRAQRGDERACRDLVAHYQGPVFALLGRLLCSARRREIEVLAEETFLRVLRDLPRFSIVGAARLSSFILTVATRRGLDEIRRRRVRHSMLRDALPAPDHADLGGEGGDVGAAVRLAAAALPPESRAILLLRDYHQLELQEIARALELEVGVVRTRLGQARAAIRAAVGDRSMLSGAGDG